MPEVYCELKNVCLALLFRYYNAGVNFHAKGLTEQNAMTSRQCYQFTRNHQGPQGHHLSLAVPAKLPGVRL